jgi:FtsH-binding integral membrane protein
MFKKIYPALVLITLPFFASAQLTQTKTILENSYSIVRDTLIPLVFTLALLFFFWGVAKYIWSEGQGKDDGRKIMIWGVIGLFVMSCIWGIIYFIGQEIGGGVGDPYTTKVPNITR